MCQHRANLKWGPFSREVLLNQFTMSYFQWIYLEAHKCDLPRSNVNAAVGDGHTGDIVAMTV